MRTRRLLIASIAAVAIVTALGLPKLSAFTRYARDYGFGEALDKLTRQLIPGDRPSVAWDTATPEEMGISSQVLDSLSESLAARGSQALLVARDGKLVHEWYEQGDSPNTLYSTAALAKAVVGTMALLQLVADGVVDLDDRASTFIPAWSGDARKARITLRQLAGHSSGVDNVRFPPPNEVDDWFSTQPPWHRRYFENPDQRFRLALTTAPVLFEPGSAFRYSGVGYYVLARALASALEAHAGEDLRHWLARRVYRPLGIPSVAWRISYGTEYSDDGLRLFAIGSGGGITPRAAARIGQVVLDRWNQGVFGVLSDSPGLPANASAADSLIPRAQPRLGWWGNEAGAWPSLPPDALVGLGGGERVLLVVPSLGIVLVHFSDASSGPYFPAETESGLEEVLFRPIAAAVASPIGRH